jgi:hypothetical protein
MNRGARGLLAVFGLRRSVVVGALVGLCCLMSAADAFATPPPPSAQISAPAGNQTFSLNESVGTSFSCVDGAGGLGLTACEDSNGSPGSADTGFGSTGSGTLDTSSPGTFSYTVTATSSDLQSATTSISYTVVALSPNQSPLQFGSVDTHSQSTQQENFSNQSATPIRVVSSTVTGSDASNYSIQPGQDFCTGQTIPAYGSCHLNVIFYAVATGPGPKNNATLELTDDAPESIDVPLTGTALTGTLSVNPGPVDFGAQVINQGGSNSQPVTVTNNQVASVLVTNQQIIGADAASFSINGSGCEGYNIGTGNTCQIYIQFNPTSSGTKNAQLELDNDGTATPLLVSLTGQGLNGPVLTVSPPQAKYGNVALGSSGSQTFTLANAGDAPLQIQGVVLIAGSPEVFPVSNDGCSGQTIAAGSSCQVTVGFIPIAAGDKDGSLLLITNASNPGVTTVGLSGTGIDPNPLATPATGATGGTGPTGPAGPHGPPGPTGKAASPKVKCVFKSTGPAHHKKTREACAATVPAPSSHVVRVDISHGKTTYAIGTASVRRGVARVRLHVIQTMRNGRYLVTVIATDGKKATVTHYTDQVLTQQPRP